MKTLILLILVVSILLLCLVVVAQAKQITKLSNLLDRMDVALARQHSVIDDQQKLIDDTVAKKFGEVPIPKSE